MKFLKKNWGTTKPSVGYGVDWSDPISKGLVGCWLFNEGAGAFAFDIARKNKGTLTNGPTWTSGKFGKGLSFDGTNDYVNIGDVLDQTGSFSLSAWVKRAGDSPTGRAGTIVGKEMASTAQFMLEIIDSSEGTSPNTVRFITFGLAVISVYSTQTITNGQWYHIVATFDSSSITQKIYIDGVQNATQTTTGTMTANSDTLKIGYSQGTGASNNYFFGVIDDVRIYNRALSAGEVKRLYSEPFAGILSPVQRRINSVSAEVLATLTRKRHVWW